MCGDEIDRQFICNQYYKLDALHNREMILMLHFMKLKIKMCRIYKDNDLVTSRGAPNSGD